MEERVYPIELPPITAIRQMRKNLGWSQKKLAEKIGKRDTTISKIEAGDRNYHPSYQTIAQIMDVLNEATFGSTKLWDQAAGGIMKRPVVFVTSKDRVIDAVKKMEADGFSQLPVIDDGLNTGSVTESDIMAHALRPNESLSRIMGPKFPIVDTNTKLREVRRLLIYEPAVLVTNEDELGIITKHDIFTMLVQEMHSEYRHNRA